MSMTLQQTLHQAQQSGLERIDAQLLLLHVLGRPDAGRAWLLTHDTDMLAPAQQQAFDALCARRLAGEPVAYLTGRKEFYGLALQVDARVLDPRPDTETLVDWALEVLADWPAPRIVDLGTGSGAIALALAHERRDAQVWAVDASADALAVAKDNAQRLGLELKFAHGSWLQALAPAQVFDAIVTNPPYIAANDPHLSSLTHEPLSALASGADGLDDIRAIIDQAPQRLARNGWLLIEHGWDQALAVRALLHDAGFAQVQSRNDLAGIARCSGGCMTDLDRQ